MTNASQKLGMAAALTLSAVSVLGSAALAQSSWSGSFGPGPSSFSSSMFMIAPQSNNQAPISSYSSTYTGPTRTVPTIPVVPQTPPPVITVRGGDTPRTPVFTPGVPTDTTRAGFSFIPEEEPQLSPGNYQFAFAGCQGVTGKKRGYVVYPVRGSLYAMQDDATIKLARGRMLVAADSGAVKVVAGQVTATIDTGSSAIIETTPSGLTRVYTLTSFQKEKGGVAVKVASAPDTAPVNMQAGQALLVAGKDTADEELIPVDGISHQPVEGSITTQIPGVKLLQYSLDQMRNLNLLIACRPLDVQRRRKSDQVLAQVHGAVADAAADQTQKVKFAPPESSNSLAHALKKSNHDSLAGNLSVIAQGPTTPHYEAVRATAEHGVFARNNSSYQWLSDDNINLEIGTIVVHGKKAIKVNCGDKSVFIDRGAVVLVNSTGPSLKVTCLSDLAANSVRVVAGKSVLALKSGNEVLFSNRTPSLSDLYDVHKIGHRQVESRQLDNNEWVTLSQVQVVDVLAHHPLVSHVRKHGDGSCERKMIAQLITNAAALSLLGSNSGSYVVGTPDDEAGTTTVVASRCNTCGNN